jgi:ribokinase
MLLDVVVRLDHPFALDTDTYGRTRVGAGGQAANVAAWAAELGAEARVIAKRGRDAAGRLVEEELRGQGVELLGPEVERGTGTVVSVATPDGRRSMLTDRGVSPELAAGEVDPAWLSGCDWLHVPGYGLAREPLRGAAVAAASFAARVSVDASSTAAIAAAGRTEFAAAVAALAPAVAFATEAEAALLPRDLAPTLVIKRGALGCTVCEAGREHDYPAVPARVVDTTGAGDAFAAGFLLGGASLALATAARCVAKLGAMP